MQNNDLHVFFLPCSCQCTCTTDVSLGGGHQGDRSTKEKLAQHSQALPTALSRCSMVAGTQRAW